jgi:hypothetical protein
MTPRSFIEAGRRRRPPLPRQNRSRGFRARPTRLFARRVVDKRPPPAELPEDHAKYFTIDAETKTIPIANLVPNKTAGGENAAKRMAAAANGELGKRGPITVTPLGDGKYLVIDGNATMSSVARYGWRSLPAHVVERSEAGMPSEAATIRSSVNSNFWLINQLMCILPQVFLSGV